MKNGVAWIKSGVFAVACGGLAILTSCGAPSEKSEVSVYGGTKTESGTWQNVVAIVRKGGGMFCSGTAISPTVVVTAAHCAGSSPASTQVYTGDGKEGGRVTGQYQAIAFKASPLYKSSRAGNDIAYIVLDRPMDLPKSAFVPVLSNPEEIEELIAVGQTGRIIGFGNREDRGFGVKYEVDAKITRFDKLEVTIGGQGKDSCQGDSGGPVFGKLLNGEWRVYGVTSRGGACGTGGIYGLMHANLCWIQQDSGVDLELPEGTCPSEEPTPRG